MGADISPGNGNILLYTHTAASDFQWKAYTNTSKSLAVSIPPKLRFICTLSLGFLVNAPRGTTDTSLSMFDTVVANRLASFTFTCRKRGMLPLHTHSTSRLPSTMFTPL